MWSNTIIITLLLLSLTSSYGGVVRRSIQNKPFQSGKELLTMKDASDAIKRSFKSAGKDLEDLARDLEQEVDEIAQLSAYINLTETEKMSEALAEAMNIKSLMDDQRTELAGLAKQTVSKSERILRKFKETVAGDRELGSGMRSILRDMRSLLLFSERKLKEAKETILTLREKINKIMATLRVFKGLIKAAKRRDEAIAAGTQVEDIENILNGIVGDIENGVDGYNKAQPGGGTISVINSAIGGITRLSTGIMKAVNRPDVGPMLSRALSKINGAIDIVSKQKDAMEKEVALIIIWKDAVDGVKNDVFGGDLEGGKDSDQDLFDEIQEIIEDGDVEDIYEAFEGLKDAAQNYLTTIENVCPSCAE